MIRFCSFTGESNESLSRIRLKDMGDWVRRQAFDESIQGLSCFLSG